MIDALSDSLTKEKPEATLVYGDTNSTLATAIVSNQLNIPLIHVEGGERIYRRKNVPEEINRILTDHSAVKILTSTKRALNYLEREGLGIRSMFVGDPLYDLFLWGLNSQKLNKKKLGIICFEGNWHGRTMGAQLMSGNEKQKKWIGFKDKQIFHIPFPYPWKVKEEEAETFLKKSFIILIFSKVLLLGI